MSDTAKLALPLIASAQAQKHITVNEAFTRVDALTSPTAISMDVSAPPAGVEGDAYIVAPGASGVWTGRDGALAFWVNDGWSFAAPRPGWRVWVEDLGGEAIYAGGAWVRCLIGPECAGAFAAMKMILGDVVLSGGVVSTSFAIPDRAVVFGVTGRVTHALTGAGVTGWRLGVAGSDDRYGAGIGLAKDSTVNGITGAPVGYFADTPLTVTAEGGTFDAGTIRLAIHYLALTPPSPV